MIEAVFNIFFGAFFCAMEQYGIRKRSTAERYAAALGCDWKELLD